MNLRHILFASDLSEESSSALAATLAFARQVGAAFSVLHVEYTPPGTEPGSHQGTLMGPSAHDAALREARARLVAQVTEATPDDPEVRVEVLTGDDVARTVTRCATDWGADLIVVCTHGRKGLGRLVLGSVAEGVLHHARVPVLCVPLAAVERLSGGRLDLGHVVLTTDLSDAAATPFLDVARLASVHRARLTLLHVVEELSAVPHGAPLAPPVPPADVEARVEKARRVAESQSRALQSSLDVSESGGLEVAVRVVHDEKPVRAIDQFVREHDVDLIALASHGRSGIRRLALGSVADALLRQSQVPMLVYPREVVRRPTG